MQGNVCQGEAVNFGVWDHDTESSGHNFLPGGIYVYNFSMKALGKY